MSSTCTGGTVARAVAGGSGGVLSSGVCVATGAADSVLAGDDDGDDTDDRVPDGDDDGDGAAGGVSSVVSGRVDAAGAGIGNNGTAVADDAGVAGVGVDAGVAGVGVDAGVGVAGVGVDVDVPHVTA